VTLALPLKILMDICLCVNLQKRMVVTHFEEKND